MAGGVAIWDSSSDRFAKEMTFRHSCFDPFVAPYGIPVCPAEPFGELFEKLSEVPERFGDGDVFPHWVAEPLTKPAATGHSGSGPFRTADGVPYRAPELFSWIFENVESVAERVGKTRRQAFWLAERLGSEQQSDSASALDALADPV